MPYRKKNLGPWEGLQPSPVLPTSVLDCEQIVITKFGTIINHAPKPYHIQTKPWLPLLSPMYATISSKSPQTNLKTINISTVNQKS